MKPTITATGCAVISVWTPWRPAPSALQHDPEDRKSYVTLWDNTRDLGRDGGPPLPGIPVFSQV